MFYINILINYQKNCNLKCDMYIIFILFKYLNNLKTLKFKIKIFIKVFIMII